VKMGEYVFLVSMWPGRLLDRSNVGSGVCMHNELMVPVVSWSHPYRARTIPVRRTAWLEGGGSDFFYAS